MIINLEEIKHELTDSFSEIVDIINRLVDLRESSFSSMLNINDYLEKSAKKFGDDTAVMISKISEDLNKTIISIDIKTMKDDITESSETFLRITDDLELLSYNTICTTMSLGSKGATIAHISKEIKKNSVHAKSLLENISATFTRIYDDFKAINETFSANSSKVELMYAPKEEEQPLEVSSDISRLIEYSQFHDIIIQEINAIENALVESEGSEVFMLGKKYGTLQLTIEKMNSIQAKINEIFAEVREIIKEFLYHINTDIQNIIGRADLVKSEFEDARNYSISINGIVKDLVRMMGQSESELKNAGNGITQLKKFGKSFRSLVVITAVEVARIGDQGLESVVVSMSRTEQILSLLVDKLSKSLDFWEDLKNGFGKVLNDAERGIVQLNELHSDEHLQDLFKKSAELDKEFEYFNGKFSGNKFISHFDNGTDKVARAFASIKVTLKRNFDDYERSLPRSIFSNPDFEAGRSSASIVDIIAHEDQYSSVDFF
jgi:hypothetical protein